MKRYHLLLVVCSLILFGVCMRLSPHVPNFTPITALAFIGGLYLGKRWTIILPGVVLIVSDAMIGFYDWKILLSVYGSFALIGFLSMFLSHKRSVLLSSASLVGSSLVFFLITNAAVWAFSPWYEKTLSGLLYSYELGLPFLRNMLIGDVLYTVLLVSLFEAGHVFCRQINYPQKVQMCSSALSSVHTFVRTLPRGQACICILCSFIMYQ